MVKENLKSLFLNAFYLMLITVLCGMFMIGVILVLDIKIDALYSNQTIAPTFKEIYFHNVVFSMSLLLPVIGILKYIFSMLYSFIVIGLSINQSGLLFVVKKLYHLPIELYAFCLILDIVWRIFQKDKVKLACFFKVIITSVLLLGFAAYVESCL